MTVSVVEVQVAATHDLRRRVLREGTPSDAVELAGDHDPATVHLAAVDVGDRVIGVATSIERACPRRPGAAARQLRGMAVDPAHQCRGIGRVLVDALVARARAGGATVVWANARDSAGAFYVRLGFTVEGEGFVTDDTALPHHVVVLDLG
jgi:GNAT superfamily N-acetyltransferase